MRWLKIADVDEGVRQTGTSSEVRRAARAEEAGTRRGAGENGSCAGRRRSSHARSPQISTAVLTLRPQRTPVPVTCRVSASPSRPFYAGARNRSATGLRRGAPEHVRQEIHAADRRSVRFIAMNCPPAGSPPAENKVARLCRNRRIWSAFAEERPGPQADRRCHDRSGPRQFTVRPDRTWLGGDRTTENTTAKDKLFLRDQGTCTPTDRRLLGGTHG